LSHMYSAQNRERKRRPDERCAELCDSMAGLSGRALKYCASPYVCRASTCSAEGTRENVTKTRTRGCSTPLPSLPSWRLRIAIDGNIAGGREGAELTRVSNPSPTALPCQKRKEIKGYSSRYVSASTIRSRKPHDLCVI
jgi:hypothetical protein